MDLPGGSWPVYVLDAIVAALLISGAGSIGVAASARPSDRRLIARAALIGLLVVPALVLIRPFRTVSITTAIAPLFGPRSDGPWPLDPALLRAQLEWILLATGVALVALAGGRSLVGWLAKRRLLASSRRPSTRLDRLYRELLGTRRRRPALQVVRRVRGPALLGAWRPRIVVPEAYDTEDGLELAALGLRHELAHLDAHDPASRGLSTLIGALWGFLPTVWWLRAQLRIDEEFLADEAASKALGSRSRYASRLLDASRPTASGPLPAARVDGPPHHVGIASDLGRRILMLQESLELADRPVPWRRRVGTLAAAMGFTLAACTLTTASREPDLGLGPDQAPPEVLEIRRIAATMPKPPPGMPLPGFRIASTLPSRFRLEFSLFASGSELANYSVMGIPCRPGIPPTTSPTITAWRCSATRDGSKFGSTGGRTLGNSPTSPWPVDLSIVPPPPYRLLIRDLRLIEGAS